jgi:hypothetical protein
MYRRHVIPVHESLSTKDHREELRWILCCLVSTIHTYSAIHLIPNPLLGIAPSLPYLSYAARSWSSLSIWYASPICHSVSPAIPPQCSNFAQNTCSTRDSTYFLELCVRSLIAGVLVCTLISFCFGTLRAGTLYRGAA